MSARASAHLEVSVDDVSMAASVRAPRHEFDGIVMLDLS